MDIPVLIASVLIVTAAYGVAIFSDNPLIYYLGAIAYCLLVLLCYVLIKLMKE